jgi:leucyl aminopeptidase
MPAETNGTVFEFATGQKARTPSDVLLVPLVTKPHPPLPLVKAVDDVCGDAVSALLALKAVGTDAGHLAHTTSAGPYRRILVASLGPVEKLTGLVVRQAATAAARWLIAEKLRNGAVWLDGLAATGLDQPFGEWAAGMALAGFRFTEFLKRNDKNIEKVRVQLRAAQAGLVRRAITEVKPALTLASAVNYARRLAHLPGNVINPESLAQEARRLARECGLRCTLIDAREAQRLGMGGLLAVGSGSAHAPCLIQLEYRPRPDSRRNTVLVGKAITFDTGGYSIKPAAGLDTLKFDKCGGAAVMGVLKAASELALPCNVAGVIAAAENAISDRAYRPGDILRMASGKTVEVISTDAEGRLVLADALWYAQKKLAPTEIIDIATLTGGAGVALGQVAAGLMSTDDELAGVLGECGRAAHERLWRLPLWDEYRELIKGTDADIRNASGKREAQAIVGGMFLKEFIEAGVAWAHLDIAAVATTEEVNALTGKGATGFGVQLLAEYLRRTAQ